MFVVSFRACDIGLERDIGNEEYEEEFVFISLCDLWSQSSLSSMLPESSQ